VRLGVLIARVLLVVAIVVVLGLGGSLLEGRGALRRRLAILRGRVGVVALILVVAGSVGFVIALLRQLRS
jgi:hypothetical protein